MKTMKKLKMISATILITSAIGTAYAEDSELIQTNTQTQDRIRTHINLQTADVDSIQSLTQDQTRVMENNQKQFRYMTGSQTGKSNNHSAEMNRYNSLNRHMQNSSASGTDFTSTANRVNSSTRSMAGGHR